MGSKNAHQHVFDNEIRIVDDAVHTDSNNNEG